MELFENTETSTTVKEFSYGQEGKLISYYACIIRRETPDTETGITWEVLKQIGKHTPVQFCTERALRAACLTTRQIAMYFTTDKKVK